MNVQCCVGNEHYRKIAGALLYSVFGSKRDGVKGEWRRLDNEELNDLYSHQILLV
jgi:hypothetical protein